MVRGCVGGGRGGCQCRPLSGPLPSLRLFGTSMSAFWVETRKMVRQAQQQQGGGDSGGRWCSTFKGSGGSGDAAWISCCAAGAETSRKLKYEESLSLVPSAQLSTPPQWSLNLAGLSVGGDVCVCVRVRARACVRGAAAAVVCGGWALLQLFPKPRRQYLSCHLPSFQPRHNGR